MTKNICIGIKLSNGINLINADIDERSILIRPYSYNKCVEM